MTTKTKSKKKLKKRIELGQGWDTSKVDLTKLKLETRLLKRLCGSGVGASKKIAKESSVAWLTNADVDPDTVAKVNSWHAAIVKQSKLSRVSKEIFQELQAIEPQTEDPSDAVLVLMGCQAIRAIASHCDYEQWQTLVSHLLEIAQFAESNVGLSPPVYQQLAIEVPLTIAFQIPEVKDYQELASGAAVKLARMISEMLDHDGWPHARYLSEFGPVVASWARCDVIVDELELEQSQESASQLEWLVRQVLRMMRPDETILFSGFGATPISAECLNCLMGMSSDPEDTKLMRIRLPKLANGKAKKKSKVQPATEVEPSNLSEWSESAVIRSRWSKNSPLVGVDFSKDRCTLEICRDIQLVQGNARPFVSFNGTSLAFDGAFEVICTESRDDVEYLELEKDLGKGVKLTRQFLLSRTEEFLLMADMVVSKSAGKIEYRTGLPLANGVEVMRESETREVYLTRDKDNAQAIQALVIPLALPEWKVGRTDDSLVWEKEPYDPTNNENGALTLTQSAEGLGLYAPLFIDLNPKRSCKKRTWRQLTVAENLKTLRRDAGCAYRVQLDKRQWIFYRSVASIGNRTFMGQNINSEFVFCRFEKDGHVETLIEI